MSGLIARRSLFGFIAAPAIIRVADLMPIKIWTDDWPPPVVIMNPTQWAEELARITKRAFIPQLEVQLYTRNPMLSLLLAEAA